MPSPGGSAAGQAPGAKPDAAADEKDYVPAQEESKAVVMAGAPHTLFSSVKDGKLVIEMASRRDTLLGYIQTAVSALQKKAAEVKDPAGKKKYSDAIPPLLKLKHAIDDLQHQALPRKFGAQEKFKKQDQDQIDALLNLAVSALQQVATDCGLTDLDGAFVHSALCDDAFKLKGFDGVRIRKELYGGWDSGAKAHRLTLLKKAMVGQEIGWFMCPGKGHAVPLNLDDVPVLEQIKTLKKSNKPADKTKAAQLESKIVEKVKGGENAENAQLDHDKPVSTHWEEKGHNTTQEERESFYNDLSNLKQVICSECNNEREKGKYVPEVGPKFRAKGEKLPGD